MKCRNTPGARVAFTIVELLVAMALIIFIMYILAEAFAAGTSAFRNLKAIGDMNERLRSAGTTLRRYLQADHFEGRKRLSDVDFWKYGPPQEGFFRIVQSGPSVNEGNDLDGLPSFQSNTQALHFTVKLRGNNRGDYFRASVPAGSPLLSPTAFPFMDSRFQDPGSNVLCSSVAEVAIFLQDSGVTTEDIDSPTNVPQSLYTMFFRQRVLVPDNSLIAPPVSYNTPANNWQNYLEVSATQDPNNAANMYVNNLQDVTMPARRWGKPNAMPDTSSTSPANYIAANSAANSYLTLGQENGALAGSDVLLTDVLSCQISVLLDNNAYVLYTPSNAPANTVPGTTPRPFDFVELSNPNDDIMDFYTAQAKVPRIFDTWSNRKDDVYDYSTTPPPMYQYTHPTVPNHPLNGTKIRIRAIKIALRIWDSRTKQTRMTSIVVDM